MGLEQFLIDFREKCELERHRSRCFDREPRGTPSVRKMTSESCLHVVFISCLRGWLKDFLWMLTEL